MRRARPESDAGSVWGLHPGCRLNDGLLAWARLSAKVHGIAVLSGVFLAAAVLAQPAQLTIDRSTGLARVSVAGSPGNEYDLEGSTDTVTSNSWKSLVVASPTNTAWSWFDAESARMPQRFYRVVERTNAGAPPAADFRLTDHQGHSRHLGYYLPDPATRSIVLVFTANDCARVGDMLSPIKSLRDQFAPQGVRFWMVDSHPADTWSNIAAQAAARGIDLPILHDPAQLVAREYGAVASPEAFVLKKDAGTGGWAVAYRGAVDDRPGPAPAETTQYYLSNALAAVVADQSLTLKSSAAAGCDLPLNPPAAAAYSADIAPLLAEKCVRCHSAGNVAPWSMTNYDIVRAYAPLIKDKILTGEMPPWHADPDHGGFTNDFSLAPQQAAALVQWVNDGAPRGNGPDPLAATPPPPTNYPNDWPSFLGPPDAVLSIPAQTIPASGVLDYRYFDVPTSFATDAWVRAAVILPGNRKVVHHSLAFFGSDAVFKGLLGFFAIYIPGYDPAVAPEGTARLLPKGTVLQFQMHYVTTGQPETDQTRIGLYLSPAPPKSILQTKSAWNLGFVIPPGSPDTRATATYNFAKGATLYEMVPHMHLRGTWFQYEAVYPDQTREILLSVPDYDFHWQALYRLARPRFIPAGTQLICTGGWDNSALNPDNPDPGATVTFGEQTFDEMFIGYFDFAESP